MSQLLINEYLNELETLKRVSGTNRESVVREAFKDLLRGWARSHDWCSWPSTKSRPKPKTGATSTARCSTISACLSATGRRRTRRTTSTQEIEQKFRRGYPQDNIIFEDSTEAVLIQNRQEVMRCGVDDVDALEKLLSCSSPIERPEIAEFRERGGKVQSRPPGCAGSAARA